MRLRGGWQRVMRARIRCDEEQPCTDEKNGDQGQIRDGLANSRRKLRDERRVFHDAFLSTEHIRTVGCYGEAPSCARANPVYDGIVRDNGGDGLPSHRVRPAPTHADRQRLDLAPSTANQRISGLQLPIHYRGSLQELQRFRPCRGGTECLGPLLPPFPSH